jgi:hypothetical protein
VASNPNVQFEQCGCLTFANLEGHRMVWHVIDACDEHGPTHPGHLMPYRVIEASTVTYEWPEAMPRVDR